MPIKLMTIRIRDLLLETEWNGLVFMMGFLTLSDRDVSDSHNNYYYHYKYI